MLRTRVPVARCVVQRGFQEVETGGLPTDVEPESLGEEVPCRGGAWGDRDACLTHGGSRIRKQLGGRCEWSALGEEIS